MNKADILAAIEEATLQSPGTLTGQEALSSVENWDSLTGSEFRLILQDRFQAQLSGAALLQCQTIPDILSQLGVRDGV
jgi:acyl carrier protein